MDSRFKIYCGEALEVLQTIEDCSVNTCVTSPPYFGLRDYGTAEWVGGDPNCPHYRTSKYSKDTTTGHKAMMEQGEAIGDAIYKTVCPLCGAVRVDKQIGLEETPQDYINKLVEIFREVRRVLKDDGTLWVNIGDTYNASGHSRKEDGSMVFSDKSLKQTTNVGSYQGEFNKVVIPEVKPKDLIGIPWMLAFALREDGWYLRQDIIWAKPNCMPESVKDRCTKSHEYIFLLSKSPKYYFDYETIMEDAVGDVRRYKYPVFSGSKEENVIRPNSNNNKKKIVHPCIEHEEEGTKTNIWSSNEDYTIPEENLITVGGKKYSQNKFKPRMKRLKRDVWFVAVNNFKEAHFATFPENLIEPCILSGCPEGGMVLDPFSGSGTTGVVANKHNRNYIGIELNQEYADMSEKRLKTLNAKEKLW